MSHSENKSWKSAKFRESITRKLEEALQESGRMPFITSEYIENLIFEDASNKDEYLNYVAKWILQLRDPPRATTPQPNIFLPGIPNPTIPQRNISSEGMPLENLAVQQGISLESLALQHGIPLESLAVQQGVSLESMALQHGIPLESLTVKQGVSLESLALQHGVSLESLAMQQGIPFDNFAAQPGIPQDSILKLAVQQGISQDSILKMAVQQSIPQESILQKAIHQSIPPEAMLPKIPKESGPQKAEKRKEIHKSEGSRKKISQKNNWKTTQFRENMTAKLEAAMLRSGVTRNITSADLENHIFKKASNKDEYLDNVAKWILRLAGR